jgi:hypothetical protein
MHSCLSPCADDDMTPATVAGMAKLAGAQLIAITDHNSARNLPAAQAACDAYGLRLLPGIEVNTAEEIHLLCYFRTVSDALAYGALLYDALPAFPYDANIWGKQLVMDADDNVVDTVDKLLTGAVSWDIYQAKAACEAMGGIAIPAHVEKDSYSLLSVLGFLPDDLHFSAFELRHPEKLPALVEAGLLPAGHEILTSSDAHCIDDIACCLHTLDDKSVLRALL